MTEQEDTKKSLAAIESCFGLIANGSFPYIKHDEVRAALAFLDELHTQLKADMPAEDGVTVPAQSPEVLPPEMSQ